MRRIPKSEATEAATALDPRDLFATPGEGSELLWARLCAYERALPALLDQALRRLFDEELAVRPEQIRATVLQLLERARADHGPFVLRVHPDDRPHLEGLPVDLELQDDPTLQRGGCVLSAPAFELDGSVQARLSRVIAALRGA